MKNATSVTSHQKAMIALVEIAVFTPELRASIPDAEPSVSYDQIPALFRRAIKEHATRGEERYKEEVAILKHALMLLEQGGDETTRTPEQEKFYESLAWWSDNGLRVKYEPMNVTVN